MPLIESLSAAQLLVFAASTLLLLALLAWRLLAAGFRHEPPGFLRRTLMDATGQPNGVLLTVLNAVVMMNALSINGMLTRGWPPAYVWATWGTIVLLGIGADAKVTLKQIENGKARAGFSDAGPGFEPGCDESPVSGPAGTQAAPTQVSAELSS